MQVTKLITLVLITYSACAYKIPQLIHKRAVINENRLSPLISLPVELWQDTFTHLLHHQQALSIRLLSPYFNSLIIKQIYNKYYINIFYHASKNGDLAALTRIYTYFSTKHSEPHIAMIRKSLYHGFRIAAAEGMLNVVQQIYLWGCGGRLDMIKSEDYYGFRWSAMNGYLRVVQQMYNWELIIGEGGNKMIASNGFGPWYCAIREGHVGIIQRLFHWYTFPMAMLQHGDYFGFQLAAGKGKFAILQQMVVWNGSVAMILANLNTAFRLTAARGNLRGVKQTYEWAGEGLRKNMIDASGFAGYWAAVGNVRLEVVELIRGWAAENSIELPSLTLKSG